MKSKPKSFAAKKKRAAPKEALPVRKIVQISPMAGGEHFVLCDDGSVWVGGSGNWARADVDKIIADPAPAP
jgi:hypothetical protein